SAPRSFRRNGRYDFAPCHRTLHVDRREMSALRWAFEGADTGTECGDAFPRQAAADAHPRTRKLAALGRVLLRAHVNSSRSFSQSYALIHSLSYVVLPRSPQ